MLCLYLNLFYFIVVFCFRCSARLLQDCLQMLVRSRKLPGRKLPATDRPMAVQFHATSVIWLFISSIRMMWLFTLTQILICAYT